MRTVNRFYTCYDCHDKLMLMATILSLFAKRVIGSRATFNSEHCAIHKHKINAKSRGDSGFELMKFRIEKETSNRIDFMKRIIKKILKNMKISSIADKSLSLSLFYSVTLIFSFKSIFYTLQNFSIKSKASVYRAREEKFPSEFPHPSGKLQKRSRFLRILSKVPFPINADLRRLATGFAGRNKDLD